jgi:NADH dehydrogenase FAD-containing subunit
MSAQIAAQAGKGVGANAAAFVRGRELRALALNDLGWVVDLGGGQGVAEVLGIPLADRLSDRLVPLLHTAIDYRNLWQLGGIAFMRAFGPGGSTSPTHDQLARDLEAFGVELD